MVARPGRMCPYRHSFLLPPSIRKRTSRGLFSRKPPRVFSDKHRGPPFSLVCCPAPPHRLPLRRASPVAHATPRRPPRLDRACACAAPLPRASSLDSDAFSCDSAPRLGGTIREARHTPAAQKLVSRWLLHLGFDLEGMGTSDVLLRCSSTFVVHGGRRRGSVWFGANLLQIPQ